MVSFEKDTLGNVLATNSNTGLYKWDGVTLSWVILPSPRLTSIAVDRTDNTIYVGTDDVGFISINGSSITSYDICDCDFQSNWVKSLTVDQQGMLWMVTSEGMISFDGSNYTVYNDSTVGMQLETSEAIKIDPYNNKWIGTPGILIFNEAGVTVDTDKAPLPLVSNNMTIWPNPVTDILNVKSESVILQAEIFNTNGKLLSRTNIGAMQTTLPLTSLKSGVYILRITSLNGTRAMKFVVP